MATPQRLPIVNSDDGTWGDILRQYIAKEHFNDDTDNAANGGHQKITVKAGTSAAGTAPIKLSSGTLMTAAEAGAIEFNNDFLYFTISTGSIRKKLALYDDTAGATGDLYYRNSSGIFSRLPVGSGSNVLSISGGLPTWQEPVTPPVIQTPTAVWGDAINVGSIQAGSVTYVRVPYSGTISEWHLVANASCTCSIDIWKAASALPTLANTITASAKPNLSASTTASSNTLTGWTTAVAASNVFGFKLESFSGSPTEITLTLKVA